MRLFEKFTIFGCDARGDGDSAYLTRYRFPRIGSLRPAIHVFHRSDHDEMHDHPWPFVSIILWRGYIEETPIVSPLGTPLMDMAIREQDQRRSRKRVWPGMILYRPATHVHRVVLVDGKKAVTFVVMGKRVREWGFWTSRGWQRFKEYFLERGC